MYCGKCNMREVASNPYGIDVCPDCSRAETDKLDTERIGNEYTINIYEQRIAELEAQNAELKLAMVVYAREELGNMCFEDDSEVVEYFLEYAKAEDK